jgi:BNR repeat protein
MKKLVLFILAILAFGSARCQTYLDWFQYSHSLPDYSSLSNVELIVQRTANDGSGLVNNTTNDFGTVSSGSVTALKSVAPGPLGRNFTVSGTAPTLSSTGIVFGGSGNFVSSSAASTWSFLHYNATAANRKWTAHAVFKFGTGSDPNAAYGLFGTNASTNANIGANAFFDDRSSLTRNDGFSTAISAGSGNAVSTYFRSTSTIPNQLSVITLESYYNTNLGAQEQAMFLNGKQQYFYNNLTPLSPSSSAPTYTLDIGGVGNSALRLTGAMEELILQSTVSTTTVRDNFIQGLINKYSITVQASPPPPLDLTRIAGFYEGLTVSNKYYLGIALDQSPLDANRIIKCTRVDVQHVPAGAAYWQVQRSTDKGVTFTSAVDIPGLSKTALPSPLSAVGGAGGYSADGRFHLFNEVRSANTSLNDLLYSYSDDDGVTWTTASILSAIPSDGLAGAIVYGNMIENNGVLMVPYYKMLSYSDFSSSANYILRSTNGGTTWTSVAIRAPASTYINEMSILGLSSTVVICLARNDATFEWMYYRSSDNGVTWSVGVDAAFGETFDIAGPGMLTKFMVGSTEVVGWLYTYRGTTPLTRAVFGKTADIISSNVSGFNTSTKTTFINSGRRLHYFDVIPYQNDFNMLVSGALEFNPVDLAFNQNYTASIPASTFSAARTALGL